jgi:hypothetical protein
VKYSNRSTWNRIISSPLSTLVLILLTFIIGRAVFNIYQKAGISEAKLNQAELELAKLTQYKNEISERVGNLSTEQGLETEVRTKYHAVKQGESVAVIVDDSQLANITNASTSSQISTLTIPWWRKLMRRFGFGN